MIFKQKHKPDGSPRTLHMCAIWKQSTQNYEITFCKKSNEQTDNQTDGRTTNTELCEKPQLTMSAGLIKLAFKIINANITALEEHCSIDNQFSDL